MPKIKSVGMSVKPKPIATKDAEKGKPDKKDAKAEKGKKAEKEKKADEKKDAPAPRVMKPMVSSFGMKTKK